MSAALRLILLTAVNAVLVLGVLRLLAMPVDVTPTPPGGGRQAAGAAAPDGAAPDLSGLDRTQVLARPLFAPDRRPWQPPPAPEVVEVLAEEPEVVAEPPPDLVLLGVAISEGRAAALIGDLGGMAEPAWVSEGETVLGWTVGAVTGQAVTLTGDGREVALTLYPGAGP
jgi:hypothetical protein